MAKDDFTIHIVGNTSAMASLENKQEMIGVHLKETVEDIATFAAFTAQDYVGKQTGNLGMNITSTKASLSAEKSIGNAAYEARAGVRKTAPYGKWVEEGTGIYGPHNTPIVSPTGKTLVFFWRGQMHYRKSVRGQKPQRYMRRAYETTKTIYVPAALKALEAKLNS
jgi:hypothetical protein